MSLALREVIESILIDLMPRLIKMPTRDTLQEQINFCEERWGFPQFGGAIDGSHIPILRPGEYHTDYFNRKGWYSIILQALVDCHYCFTDIYVGWPGRVHDARVFKNSPLLEKAQRGTLFPNMNRVINGRDIPVLVLGDPAYPLMNWLMKPFPDNGQLRPEKSNFNYRLSRARMVVENAFGRLKGRWRILLKRIDCDLQIVPQLISACCVLHNLCERSGDVFNPEWLEEQEEDEQPVADEINVNFGDGKDIRDALVAYLT